MASNETDEGRNGKRMQIFDKKIVISRKQ